MTEIAFLSKTMKLSCPQLIPSATVDVIIWSFNGILMPLPLSLKHTNNREGRFRGGENGTLILDNVEYSDSMVYTCKAYGAVQLYEVEIDVTVRGTDIDVSFRLISDFAGPPNKITNFHYESLSETVLKFTWDINVTNSNLVEYYNITLCKRLFRISFLSISMGDRSVNRYCRRISVDRATECDRCGDL